MNTFKCKHNSTSALITLAAFAVLLLGMDRMINIFDEGIVLSAAMRILDGQVVHRDFYSVYGPGSYVLVAALFKAFGPSFIVARLYGIAVAAGIVGLSFAILRRQTRLGIALTISVVVTGWQFGCSSYLYPIFPCLLLMLISIKLTIQPTVATRTASLLAVGACAGTAAYFRYDTGFFLLFAETLAIAIPLIYVWPDHQGLSAAARAIALLCVGAGAVFLPGALAYLFTSPLSAFRADIIDYTIHFYGRMRGLPFPRPSDLIHHPSQLIIYMPLVIAATAIPLVRQELQQERGRVEFSTGEFPNVPISFALVMMTLVIYYKGMVRVHPIHMTLSIIPAVLLLGLLVERWCKAGKRLVGTVAILMLMLLTAPVIMHPLIAYKRDPERSFGGYLASKAGIFKNTEIDVESACPAWDGMRLSWLPRPYALAAYYIAHRTDPDDKVLAGLDRHDKIFVNPLALNFATNRLPATHWSEYDPGLQNSANIQTIMVSELARGDTPYIVRDSSFDAINEPNDSALSSGVHLLDDYIASHFHLVAQSGLVQIWARNDVAVPPLTSDPPGCRLDGPDAKEPAS